MRLFRPKHDDPQGRWRKGEVGFQVEGPTNFRDLWLDFGPMKQPSGTRSLKRVYGFGWEEVEPVTQKSPSIPAVVARLEAALAASPPPGISTPFVKTFFAENRERLAQMVQGFSIDFMPLVNLLDEHFSGGARLIEVRPKADANGWSAAIELANDDNDLQRFSRAGRQATQDLSCGLVVQSDLQKESPSFLVVVDAKDQEEINQLFAALRAALVLDNTHEAS